MSLSEIIFDYTIMKEGPNELAVSVGVVPEEIIQKSIDIYRKAGIVPLGFTIEAQAVAYAVIPRGSKENIIVVTLKRNKIIVALTGSRGVFVSATLDAPAEFDKEVLKNQINKYYIYWLTHKANGGDVAEKLDRIIIVGKRALSPGLVEFLSDALRVPVLAANVWENCLDTRRLVPGISREESFLYAEAIGLLIS